MRTEVGCGPRCGKTGRRPATIIEIVWVCGILAVRSVIGQRDYPPRDADLFKSLW